MATSQFVLSIFSFIFPLYFSQCVCVFFNVASLPLIKSLSHIFLCLLPSFVASLTKLPFSPHFLNPPSSFHYHIYPSSLPPSPQFVLIFLPFSPPLHYSHHHRLIFILFVLLLLVFILSTQTLNKDLSLSLSPMLSYHLETGCL